MQISDDDDRDGDREGHEEPGSKSGGLFELLSRSSERGTIEAPSEARDDAVVRPGFPDGPAPAETKRRGRPRKPAPEGPCGPAEGPAENGPVLEIKPKPRKKASPSGPSKEEVSRFAEALILMHAFVASSARLPEMMIGGAEAEALSAAIQNVGRWYGASSVVSEKQWDWINLGICLAGTYGPRVSKIVERTKAAKAKPVEPATAHMQQDVVFTTSDLDTAA